MFSFKEIRFTDVNESVKGDGSNLILTSGGTAFTVGPVLMDQMVSF